MQLSENFHSSEFACKCKQRGLDKTDHWCHGEVWAHEELVNRLQTLRDLIGKPIHVFSGCRCPAYNAYVSGARMSQHKRGTAADISVRGMTPFDLAHEAAKVGHRGVISYPTFVHVDVRETPVFQDIREAHNNTMRG